jgi:hypothetical protein
MLEESRAVAAHGIDGKSSNMLFKVSSRKKSSGPVCKKPILFALVYDFISFGKSACRSICYEHMVIHFPETNPDGVARNKKILETFKPNCFDFVRKRKDYRIC